jgi:hypothetical protein
MPSPEATRKIFAADLRGIVVPWGNFLIIAACERSASKSIEYQSNTTTTTRPLDAMIESARLGTFSTTTSLQGVDVAELKFPDNEHTRLRHGDN